MPSQRAKSRTIRVNYLTRAEGEGALRIRMRDGELVDLRLEIFEAPRFFEAFLRGRDSREAPDLTARICGICPVAYQMSTVHAFERLYGITVDPAVRELRRLFLCGEWIESHALHIHMLAAPDFLGCDSIITLADKNREAVERGLRIKKVGNAIVAALGGRSVHPVGACIGGFTRAPRREQLADLRERLLRVRADAVECVRWVSHFDLPSVTRDIEFVSLRHAEEYPMNEGRIASSKGIDAAPDLFDDFFEEHQVPYSNALHCKVKGRGPYFLGPLARVNLNFDRMGPDVTAAARETGIAWPNSNPYTSIVARALEVLYAIDEALRVIDAYRPPHAPAASFATRSGVGRAITEAPRGSLYHAFETDERGLIHSARIAPPTSQNQAQIEADLRDLVPDVIQRSQAEATHMCEMAIRNYDPCISCSTHFLKLEIARH
ncbi:MAG TPA: nickel-dependent hydrogenase large subunit [Candidatus Binataceae bacterium]|nr:nickel-dependent hydrogenase large subunit [Candidatus Binataceae bacterium]